MGRRAVFFDRDGTLNELVWNERFGEFDSPAHPDDVRLVDGAIEAVRRAREAGLQVAVVSNQPGMAKGKFDRETFDAIDRRFASLFAAAGVEAPPRYYCLHHPDALVAAYREVCDCRKPSPGLLVRAAAELGVALEGSVVIGDTHRDVGAAKAAGCYALLCGPNAPHESEAMRHRGLEPDAVAPDVLAAVELVVGRGLAHES